MLAGWRLLHLEASIRRDERRFPEALELLDQARASCGNDPLATGRILLDKEFVFEQSGDLQHALSTLAEAAPFVETSGNARMLFALRFKTVNHLYYLERFEEATTLLTEVRELAIRQANEMDLIRVSWLTARIAAGLGKIEEAVAGLEAVREDFTSRQLPYDAALVSLDLAMLWLKTGHSAQVKKLAVTMGWIFREKGIDREALAALNLFVEAVQQETVTVDLTQHIIEEITRTRRPTPSRPQGRGRS